MNIKFVALAMTFALTTGCALNGQSNRTDLQQGNSRAASSESRGASSAGTEQAGVERPAGRTRAEVHAEAVEAVKHYKSTQSEERDYFNPYAQ